MERLNNRPRKYLGINTPIQVFCGISSLVAVASSIRGHLYFQEMNPPFFFFQHRPYLTITCMVVVIFLFSSNRAWVEHRVDGNGGYSVSAFPKNIPFMWQYDSDAMEFFQAAALFPDYYRSHPALVGRPALPLLSHVVGNGIFLIVKPLLGTRLTQFLFEGSGASSQASQTMGKRGEVDKNQIEFLLPYLSALIGFIAVKIAFFIFSGWAMFRLLCRYTDQGIAVFAIALLFFSPYAIRSIGTYHTYEFQILTPIIVIFLFHRLCESYSLRRNMLYSLVIGALMMGKANYAAYFAVIIYAAFFLKPRSIVYVGLIVSGAVHLVPWAIWTAFIEMRGMPVIGLLSLSEPQAIALHPLDIIGKKLSGLQLVSDTSALGINSQVGVDFVDNIFHLNILEILSIIRNNLVNSIATFATLSGLLAVAGLTLFKNHAKRNLLLFFAIFFFATWMQAFFSYPYGPKSRVLFDVNFVVFSFSSFSVFFLARRFLNARRSVIPALFLSIYIFFNCFSFVKFPWVHPYDQITWYTTPRSFIDQHTDLTCLKKNTRPSVTFQDLT